MIARIGLQSPLLRAAAVIGVVLVAVAISAATAGSQTTGAGVREPYPPFQMTYVQNAPPEQGGVVTVELTWNHRRSWNYIVVDASVDTARRVGSTTTYDGKTLVIDNPATGTTVLTPEHAGGVTSLPFEWLIPQAFGPVNGWEALGSDADGNLQYERMPDEAPQFRTLYKVDPATGMVVEVMRWDGYEYVTGILVTSLEILTEAGPQ